MYSIWKKGEIATALLVFSLLAMGVGSLIGVREIQKGTTNTIFSRAQDTCLFKSDMHILDTNGNPFTHTDLKVQWAHYKANGTNGYNMDTPLRSGESKVPNGTSTLGQGAALDAASRNALARITLPDSSLYKVVAWKCENNSKVNGCVKSEDTSGDNQVDIVMRCGGDTTYAFVVEPNVSSCKYDSTVRIVDRQGKVIQHPDLKTEWAHYKAIENGEFDFDQPLRQGVAKMPTGEYTLPSTVNNLGNKDSINALARIKLPESSLYSIVGWRCRDVGDVKGCQEAEKMDGSNTVDIVMKCGGKNVYEYVVDSKITPSPTPAVACNFGSLASIKDDKGNKISAAGKYSGFAVEYRFTNTAGKVYSGETYFDADGEIKTPSAPLRNDLKDQNVELTLKYNQNDYDLVKPECSDDNPTSKSCQSAQGDKIVVKYTCDAKNKYGWVLKQKPMTAQFGLFTPDAGHKCAVSANNVDFKQDVHHAMHGNIKCTETYHKDTDMFEVVFKIKDDGDANLGDSPILFRTSRCLGIQAQCEEPILRQLRVKELKRGNGLRCFWKHPFSPGSDTPDCDGVTIPARPPLTGTIDSIVMQKGDATYIYSRSVDGCTRVYTGGNSSCKAQGLKCSNSTKVIDGKTYYGAELKIEDENATGLVRVGESKGCPCNEDGICDESHKYIPGTQTIATTYKTRALHDACLGDEKSKLTCYIDGPVGCEKGGNGYGSCKNMTIGRGSGDKNAQLDVNRSYWTKRNYGSCSTAANDHGTCPAGYKCSATESTVTVQKVCGQSSQRIYIERFYDCACNPSGQCREDLGGRYSKIIDETLENGVTCNVDTGICSRIESTCGAAPQPTSPNSCNDNQRDQSGACNPACCGTSNQCKSNEVCGGGPNGGQNNNGYCNSGKSCVRPPVAPGVPTTRPPQQEPTPTNAPSCQSGNSLENCMCTCQKGGDTLAVCAQECSVHLPPCDCVEGDGGYNVCNIGCARYGTTLNQCSSKTSCTNPPVSPPDEGNGKIQVYGIVKYQGARLNQSDIYLSVKGPNNLFSHKVIADPLTNFYYSTIATNLNLNTAYTTYGDLTITDRLKIDSIDINCPGIKSGLNCTLKPTVNTIDVTYTFYVSDKPQTSEPPVIPPTCRDANGELATGCWNQMMNACEGQYDLACKIRAVAKCCSTKPTQTPVNECECFPSEYGQGRGGCSQKCIPESWLNGNTSAICNNIENKCMPGNPTDPTPTYPTADPETLQIQLETPDNNQHYSARGNVTFNWKILGETNFIYLRNVRLIYKYKCGNLNYSLSQYVYSNNGSATVLFDPNVCKLGPLAGDLTVQWSVDGDINLGLGLVKKNSETRHLTFDKISACDSDRQCRDKDTQLCVNLVYDKLVCRNPSTSCPSGVYSIDIRMKGGYCEYIENGCKPNASMGTCVNAKTRSVGTTFANPEDDIDNSGTIDIKDALLAIQEIKSKGTLNGQKVTSYAQAISQILSSLGQKTK